MTYSNGLALAATALSVGTIVLGILFYKWQKRQGERIGMLVISTVDQIYRRIRDFGESADEVDMDDHDVFRASCSPKWMRTGEQTTLSLDWRVENPPSEFAEVTCVVD